MELNKGDPLFTWQYPVLPGLDWHFAFKIATWKFLTFYYYPIHQNDRVVLKGTVVLGCFPQRTLQRHTTINNRFVLCWVYIGSGYIFVQFRMASHSSYSSGPTRWYDRVWCNCIQQMTDRVCKSYYNKVAIVSATRCTFIELLIVLAIHKTTVSSNTESLLNKTEMLGFTIINFVFNKSQTQTTGLVTQEC